MIDIKAIKAAAEAATPQPWIDPGEGNMPFICMMTPATVIALCDEVERLTIIASELQDLCDRQAKRLALEALTEPSDSDGESFYEAVAAIRKVLD